MPQSTTNKTLGRIYGKGRAWAFSSKDFRGLGTRSAVDVALYRLYRTRGIYTHVLNRGGRGVCSPLDQVM